MSATRSNGTPGYARPEMLVETEWLAEHLGDDGLRIVDADYPHAYARAHIPGAVGHVTENVYLKTAPGETFIRGPEQYAETVGRMGIGDDSAVVVYDGSASLLAARFWWTLRYYGHKNARLLNGGWHKWLLEGRPATMEPARVARAEFTPRVNEEIATSCALMGAAVGQADVALLDVRNKSEYTGENTRGNQRRGHVPGAVHLEWSDFMTADGRKVFKPADELEEMLRVRGVTRDKRVHVY
jgi:thiosulfate/3-mercaptopyruvate sulfurtransferase